MLHAEPAVPLGGASGSEYRQVVRVYRRLSRKPVSLEARRSCPICRAKYTIHMYHFRSDSPLSNLVLVPKHSRHFLNLMPASVVE